MTRKRRKHIRLPSIEYQKTSSIFSITICTHERLPIFITPTYAKTITATMHTGTLADNTKLYAYCLMPDHLHLLIAPMEENLTKMVGRWKSYTVTQLRKRGYASKCWQRGFYDHALRKEEDIKATAEYIIHNPIRAGIVNNWYDYEHSWHMWMP